VLWTITPLNTLHLHTTLGYTEYLNHPRLDSSSILISPDSILSFNAYIGDFKINLHEQFSYQENPTGEGAVGNVEKFERYQNDAGVNVLWDANDVISTLGYDHSNFIPVGAVSSVGQGVDTSNLGYTTDELTSSVFFQIISNLGGGIEATASATSYSSEAAADATRVGIGPFIQYQLSHFTKIVASGGYQGTFFTNGGGRFSTVENGAEVSSGNSGQGNSYYASVTITNRLNRFITDQLSFGHEDEVGILSAETKTTYAQLISTVQVAPQVAITGNLSYADTDDSGAFSPLLGSTTATQYQLFSFTLSTGYVITRKLTASLQYQFIRRISGGSGSQNYTDNGIALILDYQF
jgi:hypothetical protein